MYSHTKYLLSLNHAHNILWLKNAAEATILKFCFFVSKILHIDMYKNWKDKHKNARSNFGEDGEIIDNMFYVFVLFCGFQVFCVEQ